MASTILFVPSEKQNSDLLKQCAKSIISGIVANHKYEVINILSTNGNKVDVIHSYSSELDSLTKSFEKIKFVNENENWATQLPKIYSLIEESTGIHSKVQITILTDSLLNSKDLWKIRPIYDMKVHIFCEKINNFENENLINFSKIFQGYFEYIKNIDDSIPKFISNHYGKYAGFIAYGHLISGISLHPDPNLSLWDFKIPSVLSIFGFCDSNQISSPKCISRHTILNSKKKSKKIVKKIDQNVILSNACKSDDKEASLYEILHESLFYNKLCAIIRFDEKKYQFGCITTTNEKERSALLFSIFDPEIDWLSDNFGSILSHSILDNFKSSHKIVHHDQKLFKKPIETATNFIMTPSLEEVPIYFEELVNKLKIENIQIGDIIVECSKIQMLSLAFNMRNLVELLISTLKSNPTRNKSIFDDINNIILQLDQGTILNLLERSDGNLSQETKKIKISPFSDVLN
eukprot:gene8391-216_t